MMHQLLLSNTIVGEDLTPYLTPYFVAMYI